MSNLELSRRMKTYENLLSSVLKLGGIRPALLRALGSLLTLGGSRDLRHRRYYNVGTSVGIVTPENTTSCLTKD